MKISLFKIGFTLTVIGMIWISIVFLQGNRVYEEILLNPLNSHDIQLNLQGDGIGYYKITVPEFAGDKAFVQILDKNHNVISEQKVQTKMSVGYFDFEKSEIFSVKITNISENQMNLQVEFGNTNVKNMILPGILIFLGAVMMIILSYFKLRNYNIAQPEENIS